MAELDKAERIASLREELATLEADHNSEHESVIGEAEETVVEAAEEVQEELQNGTEQTADAVEEVAETVQETAEEAADELGQPELADHIADRLHAKLQETGMLVTAHDERRAEATLPEAEAELVNDTPAEVVAEEAVEPVVAGEHHATRHEPDGIRPASEHWWYRGRSMRRH